MRRPDADAEFLESAGKKCKTEVREWLLASNRLVNDCADQLQLLKLALCVGIHYRRKHHWFNNIYILHKS